MVGTQGTYYRFDALLSAPPGPTDHLKRRKVYVHRIFPLARERFVLWSEVGREKLKLYGCVYRSILSSPSIDGSISLEILRIRRTRNESESSVRIGGIDSYYVSCSQNLQGSETC